MGSFVNGDLYMNLKQNRVFGTVRLKNHQTFHNNLSIFKKFYKVLPPFGKDKTRLANIDFTQFFCQKAPFLDF